MHVWVGFVDLMQYGKRGCKNQDEYSRSVLETSGQVQLLYLHTCSLRRNSMASAPVMLFSVIIQDFIIRAVHNFVNKETWLAPTRRRPVPLERQL
jgi:hypothetical protein